MAVQPLWTCRDCGRAFANRNQFHFCSNRKLEDHFAGREPQGEGELGFAFITLDQVHVFRLHDPAEVDAEVERWLAEAYLVGEQKHLSAARRSARPRPGS
ncbi:MAG TPA: hypothetical protein VGU71_21380 [Candidatus Dormibacteraeota bacterium]|nr:hypothetical protein [Candidatus Dormibacteraeota bacterium]